MHPIGMFSCYKLRRPNFGDIARIGDPLLEFYIPLNKSQTLFLPFVLYT